MEEDIETDGTEGTWVRIQYTGGTEMTVKTSVREKVEDEGPSGGADRASAAGNSLLQH